MSSHDAVQLTLTESLLGCLPAISIMLYLQAFAVYMLLKHAAEYEPLPGRGAKTAADKTQLTRAAEDAAALLDCFHSLLVALTEDELMQMGLPALRLAPSLSGHTHTLSVDVCVSVSASDCVSLSVWLCVSVCLSVSLCVCPLYTACLLAMDIHKRNWKCNTLCEYCGILLCGCCCVSWSSRNISLVPTSHALTQQHINLHAPNHHLLSQRMCVQPFVCLPSKHSSRFLLVLLELSHGVHTAVA